MNSPHLRRRYRASGTRSGLAYLLGLLAAASLYVGQHVYAVRQKFAVEAIRKDVEHVELELNRLRAVRDEMISLAAIEPRARELGLEAPDLAQTARLPLDAPVLYEPVTAAGPPALAEVFGKIWQWWDPPGVTTSEVRADE